MDPGGAPPEPSRREALSKALLQEGDRLYALALRITRDPDLAADAVQEAFATALERENDFRGESSLATWLHRIVYTKSIDLLRKRGREGPLPEDDPEGRAPQSEDPGAPSWARPPDALLLGRETRAALDMALGALTPVQRAIFELKEVEERPTEEVGAILGMPPGTVRVHLHRARLKLRSLLGEHFRRGRT
ncbi:MAG TPA: RNA polymerase sigma factor [Vicinamibacteria bacterium]|nr:RNA polymerase sigma factor [Vicinamibacteria bacterium]